MLIVVVGFVVRVIILIVAPQRVPVGWAKTLDGQPSQTTFANSVGNQRYGSLLLRLAAAKVN